MKIALALYENRKKIFFHYTQVVREHENNADSVQLELELDLSFAKNIRELRFQKRQLVKAKFFFKSSIHDFQNFEK